MTEPELKEVYNLYTECWKLYKEYHAIKTDQEWEKLLSITEEMVKRHGDYSRPLIMDTIIMIERSAKHGK
nr:MAG TPA: hypothetical protein [Caudoviricetes sp.]